MKLQRIRLIAIVLFACCAICAAAQDMKIANASEMKFSTLPALPQCAMAAVAKGDPSTGPATFLVKSSAGCDVPMHFHSVSEQVMMVSGTMRFQMKDEAVRVLQPGGYATTAARHPHHATCSTACEFYIVSDGPFDIHYVDTTGNEIPLEQAMKMSKKLEGGE